jgi:NTP pyrophosphatase (non-canonical NTP hydrolase)
MNNSFQQVLKKIKKFRDERDWMQFHDPKNMATAVSIEASELLEHFLWKTPEEVEQYLKNKKNKEEVSDEIADIMTYLIELADNLEIDIETAIENKMKKNAQKYPVEKAHGKADKYNKLK